MEIGDLGKSGGIVYIEGIVQIQFGFAIVIG
uniref:Uncharacterized protein n=1 Tax=Ralstonia solanacearum TaxID=305 RepID=A0A0S4VRX1_RALSL|nr:protein of unknown function [Ralstonia solanacearum]CUV37313.1 protein of unknown function [Ralstonia solanacearum]CUV42787.1 protein of unknown function [Ralstonia solanacearum]CUV63483.1 protein of unknown function [Ralstonia solanacearum]